MHIMHAVWLDAATTPAACIRPPSRRSRMKRDEGAHRMRPAVACLHTARRGDGSQTTMWRPYRRIMAAHGAAL